MDEREQLQDGLRQAQKLLDAGRIGQARLCLQQLLGQEPDGLREGVMRVTAALHAGLAGLPVRGRIAQLAQHDLADAGARLDHVLKLTEDAANQTLDLVGEAQSRVRAGTTEADLQRLREIFNEMTAAQAYQDLSGQILKRVAGLLRQTETALLELLGGDAEVAAPARPEGPELGPSVPGLDQASDQSEADALLSDLGI